MFLLPTGNTMNPLSAHWRNDVLQALWLLVFLYNIDAQQMNSVFPLTLSQASEIPRHPSLQPSSYKAIHGMKCPLNKIAFVRYLLSFSTPAANQSAEEAFCRLFPECNLSSVKNFAIQADMTKIEDELGMQTMDPQCVWADSFRTARQLNLLPEELLFKMAAKEIPKEVSVIA